MTVRSGFIKTLLLTLLAVMTALPVRSQAGRPATVYIYEDSMRFARVDSIYHSLNDTAAWQREMDYVRNLTFDEMEDSDLVRLWEDEEPVQEGKKKRTTWKDIEQEKINRYKRNDTGWEPEPRVAVWLSLLVPGGQNVACGNGVDGLFCFDGSGLGHSLGLGGGFGLRAVLWCGCGASRHE